VTLLGLMEAIADQLEQQLVFEFPTLTASAGWNFTPTPPTIDIYPQSTLFVAQTSFGNPKNVQCVFTVRARVVPTDWDNGQSVLLRMMDWDGPGSVVQALAVDDTFGGAAQSSTVEQQDGYVLSPDPYGQQADLLGTTWQLRVIP
jgi:hypothetical protein